MGAGLRGFLVLTSGLGFVSNGSELRGASYRSICGRNSRRNVPVDFFRLTVSHAHEW